MNIDMVFKIAAIGILVAVLSQVLERTGREDMATLTALQGGWCLCLIVVNLIAQLFSSVKSIFDL